MAVTHATTKIPGQTLAAVADWNAAHAGSIDDAMHGSRGASLHADAHAKLHSVISAADHNGFSGIGTEFLNGVGAFSTPAGGAFTGLKLVADTAVAGSAVQEIDFSSLDLEADRIYALFLYDVNENASDTTIWIYVNDDLTDANYTYQRLIANHQTVTGYRSTAPIIGGAGGSGYALHTNFCVVYFMKIASNLPYYFSFGLLTNGGVLTKHDSCIYHNSTTNITKINIRAERANGFGVGSRAVLFKLGSS